MKSLKNSTEIKKTIFVYERGCLMGHLIEMEKPRLYVYDGKQTSRKKALFSEKPKIAEFSPLE